MATLQINVTTDDVHISHPIHKNEHWVGQINDIYSGESVQHAFQKMQNQILLLEERIKQLEVAYMEQVLLGKVEVKSSDF